MGALLASLGLLIAAGVVALATLAYRRWHVDRQISIDLVAYERARRVTSGTVPQQRKPGEVTHTVRPL